MTALPTRLLHLGTTMILAQNANMIVDGRGSFTSTTLKEFLGNHYRKLFTWIASPPWCATFSNMIQTRLQKVWNPLLTTGLHMFLWIIKVELCPSQSQEGFEVGV